MLANVGILKPHVGKNKIVLPSVQNLGRIPTKHFGGPTQDAAIISMKLLR